MGEISEMLNEPVSTIRFWENEFEELKHKKNKKRNKQFTQEDIKLIKLIHNMLRVEKRTIEGVKVKLKDNTDFHIKRHQAIEKLTNLKEELLEIRRMLP